MKKVGVGIIGSGSIADIAHCPSIRQLDNAELVALCDNDQQTLGKMSKKWEPKRTYVNYQDLIKDKEIDVVIIATPNYLHHEQTVAALNEKKHCIVEKPFSCTHDEAWDMVNTAKKNGVMVMTGTNQKFWLQCEIAKKLIEDGFIGEPKMGARPCMRRGGFTMSSSRTPSSGLFPTWRAPARSSTWARTVWTF